MSNKRGIGLTVLVCIITSVLTSLLTIVVMKNNIGDTNQNSVSKEIVVMTVEKVKIYIMRLVIKQCLLL